MLSSILAGALLLAGAPAAQPESVPVTDIRVSWTEDRRAVRVTWREPIDQPNHVEVRYGTSHQGFPHRYLGSEQRNEAVFPVDQFARDLVGRIAISVGSPGQSDLDTRFSADFDTLTLPWPRVTAVRLTAGRTVTWTWQRVVPPPDSTPNDPLDLPTTVRYQPLVSVRESLRPTGAATTGTLFRRSDPGAAYRVGVAAPNEWAPVPDGIEAQYTAADVLASSAALRVPSGTTYGQRPTVSGQVREHAWACRAGSCGALLVRASPGRTVRLQARKDRSSPWVHLRELRTDTRGVFRTTVTTPGTRQFRAVVVSRVAGRDQLRAGVSAAPVTVVRAQLRSARFLDPSVPRGQVAVAFVSVLPRGSQPAVLQRRGTDGVYRNVAAFRLSSGRAVVRTAATQSAYYRFGVATGVVGGYRIAGLLTRPFRLTVG